MRTWEDALEQAWLQSIYHHNKIPQIFTDRDERHKEQRARQHQQMLNYTSQITAPTIQQMIRTISILSNDRLFGSSCGLPHGEGSCTAWYGKGPWVWMRLPTPWPTTNTAGLYTHQTSRLVDSMPSSPLLHTAPVIIVIVTDAVVIVEKEKFAPDVRIKSPNDIRPACAQHSTGCSHGLTRYAMIATISNILVAGTAAVDIYAEGWGEGRDTKCCLAVQPMPFTITAMLR